MAAHRYSGEEKMEEATKQTVMDQRMDPSVREARHVSPVNAGNSLIRQ